MKKFLILILVEFVVSQQQQPLGMCYQVNKPEPPKPTTSDQQPSDTTSDNKENNDESKDDGGARIAGIDFTASEMSNSYRGLRKAMQVVGEPESNNFQNDCLYMTNIYRRVLGLKPMSFSSAAYNVAQKYANYLAKTNKFEHSHIDGYGENLYRTSGGSFACHKAMNAFFEEYALYHGEKIGDGNFEGYGHFTQLIWPDTLQMACAKAVHADKRTQTIVCNYIEPGNMMGTRLDVRMGATKYRK